jgi:hypothetical protein
MMVGLTILDSTDDFILLSSKADSKMIITTPMILFDMKSVHMRHINVK